MTGNRNANRKEEINEVETQIASVSWEENHQQ